MDIEKNLKYTFKNTMLLSTALTHSSYSNEKKKGLESNERLEFLGDSVLSIITSEYLFKEYSHQPEGELTKLRAALVCEKSLCEISKALGIGECLKLGHGEEHTGGRQRPSILADAFEAMLAAIYLDSGMESARNFVLPFIKEKLTHIDSTSSLDYKTTLQEIIQQNPEEQLEYRLAGESGPDHDKRFEVEVLLNSNIIGRGEGHSKKAAEQAAAKEALKLMGEV